MECRLLKGFLQAKYNLDVDQVNSFINRQKHCIGEWYEIAILELKAEREKCREAV